MDITEGIGLALLLAIVGACVFVAVCVIFWRITRKIKNGYIRVIVRTVVFTPTIYGHAGILPAVLMLIVGKGQDRFTYGLAPILVALTLALLVYQVRRGSEDT